MTKPYLMIWLYNALFKERLYLIHFCRICDFSLNWTAFNLLLIGVFLTYSKLDCF